jgi:hypothetical protein
MTDVNWRISLSAPVSKESIVEEKMKSKLQVKSIKIKVHVYDYKSLLK